MNYRIWRSSKSRFCSEPLPTGINDETLTAVNAYDEAELRRIADAGFNAIWIHGILRHLVQVEPFPDLYDGCGPQLQALRDLIERCARFGIRVFLYMQPPRALAAVDPFWQRHPEVQGERLDTSDGALRCICTSTPQAQAWLENAGEALLRDLPELAGVILITASEFGQHCFSHRFHKPLTKPWHVEITCPRCRLRQRPEVIAELITTLWRGIRKSSATAEVVAWNWSWESPEDEAAIIRSLPEDVILMADFERGGYKDLLRRPHFFMDEYSLGYSGPSEKFLRLEKETSARPMRYMAKLQLGTTHELATVVSLPLIGTLFKKAAFIRQHHLEGYMGCWNFGNALPNLNVEAFNFFLEKECPDEQDAALAAFAKRRFPEADASFLTAAWEQFGETMFYYPFTILYIYFGVQNYTLAYSEIYKPEPLHGTPVGGSWKLDSRGDDLHEAWSHPEQPKLFTLDEIIERIGKVAVGWEAGVRLLKKAFSGICEVRSQGEEFSTAGTPSVQSRILDELGNAIICGVIWHSTENTYRVYRLRQNWSEECLPEFRRLAEDELGRLREVLPWVERDPRQGFHIEPGGYMFTPEGIRAKMKVLEELLQGE